MEDKRQDERKDEGYGTIEQARSYKKEQQPSAYIIKTSVSLQSKQGF